MKRTIFYSWQSDLPGRSNRSLIEESLTRAIRAIARDLDAGVVPVLDRDTANVAGTPDIAQSILAKIATADIFVGDVSIVTLPGAGRQAPNPNVLIELGYAVAELGWENVVLVMNSVYGGPEMLPFDLRGRRTVVYEMQERDTPAEARNLLQGRLEAHLRTALSETATRNLPKGPNAPLWWGRWNFSPAPTSGSELFIREIGPSGFLFELGVSNGAHSGRIVSYARILSSDLAYCRVPNGEGEPDGELVFRRRRGDGARTISIEETARCQYWGGMRAHFGGDFTWQVEPWFDRGYLNELELVRLYDLVGDGMETLRSCTSDTSEEWLVEDGSTRFIRGGVPGLYTEMESIVMLDDTGNMWVAYIDDAVVRYFTNVPTDRDKLPEVFESWRQNFREKEVLFSDSTRFASVSLGTTLVETSARPQPLPAPTDQPSNSWWRSIGKLFRRVR